MFNLPTFRNLWVPAPGSVAIETSGLVFIELRATDPKTGRIGFQIVAALPDSGYVTGPIV